MFKLFSIKLFPAIFAVVTSDGVRGLELGKVTSKGIKVAEIVHGEPIQFKLDCQNTWDRCIWYTNTKYGLDKIEKYDWRKDTLACGYLYENCKAEKGSWYNSHINNAGAKYDKEDENDRKEWCEYDSYTVDKIGRKKYSYFWYPPYRGYHMWTHIKAWCLRDRDCCWKILDSKFPEMDDWKEDAQNSQTSHAIETWIDDYADN